MLNPIVDEREQVENLARTYLTDSDAAPHTTITSGVLRNYEEIIHSLPTPLWLRSSVDFIRVSATRIDKDSAEVQLDGTKTIQWEHPLEGIAHRLERRYRGPMTLRKKEGSWTVEDYVVDGRSRVSQIFLELQGGQEVSRITITPVALELATRGTLLYIKVANHCGEDLDLLDAILVSKVRGRVVGSISEGFDVAPDRSETLAMASWVHALPLGTKKIRVAIYALGRRTRNLVRFDFEVGVHTEKLKRHKARILSSEEVAIGERSRAKIARLAQFALVGVVLFSLQADWRQQPPPLRESPEAREVATAFVTTLLSDDWTKSGRYLASDSAIQGEYLGNAHYLYERRGLQVIAQPTIESGLFLLHGDPGEHFSYEVEGRLGCPGKRGLKYTKVTGSLDVFMVMEGSEWRVNEFSAFAGAVFCSDGTQAVPSPVPTTP